MASPCSTNRVTVTVTVTANPAKARKLLDVLDQYVTEKAEGATVTVHASDAKWLAKQGFAA